MTYNHKKVIVFAVYYSQSQNNNEFLSFLSTFEQLLNAVNKRKPSLSVITGGFNARSSSLWTNDINTTEGLKFFSFISSNWFSQIINEPTHI